MYAIIFSRNTVFFFNGCSCGIIDFLVSFPATRLEPGESTRVVSRASPIVDGNEHVVGCLSERFVVQTGQTYGDDCNESAQCVCVFESKLKINSRTGTIAKFLFIARSV